MARRYNKKANLADDLREISSLKRPGCLARWETAFGDAPPPYLSIRFMQRALMYDLQCRVLGGHTGKTTRELRALIEGSMGNAGRSGEANPGSVLLREWNGRTYRVEVTPEGYVLDGQAFRSLSGVAKRITGANWSGPRFFGLKHREGAEMARIRCAVYTRKSTEEGLDQEFNSLDAQREACEAYIWTCRALVLLHELI